MRYANAIAAPFLTAALALASLGAGADDVTEIARAAIGADLAGSTASARIRFVERLSSRHLSRRLELFDVLIDELPLFFGTAAAQIGPDGLVERLRIPKNALLAPPEPHPDPTGSAARERLCALGIEPSIIVPGWLETPFGPRAVVRVDLIPENQLDAVSRYLDARTGTPLHEERMAQEAALGAVFRENPVTTPEVEIIELPDLDVFAGHLHGSYARVERCVDTEECKETEIGALPDENGDYLFEPDLAYDTFEDPFCEVNAYNNISRINGWARDTFGWAGLFDGETRILVKVGIAWYNAAFFSGNDEIPPYIIFGQDVIDLGYDADVAFHEFGHAINRSIWAHPWFFRDAAGANFSPFGIEEGLADIWAQNYAGDPVMNSYVLRSRTAINSLVCPDDLQGEGHMEARILSAVGWNVRERIGATAWGEIVYRTLHFLPGHFLPGDADFGSFVETLAQSAWDLALEEDSAVEPEDGDIIMEEGAARGLLDQACADRLVPIGHGDTARVYGYGRERTNERDRPFGLQWKMTADESTAAVRLAFSWLYPDDVEPGYRVHVSRGKPVLVTWLDPDEVSEGEMEFEVAADLTLEEAPDRVDYPFMGLEPLAPGEEVYFLLSADTDTPTVVVEARALHLSNLPPPPDGIAAPLDTDRAKAVSGAPSCSTATSASAASRGPFSALISILL